MTAPSTVAVFASGGGSNLQSLLDHQGTDPPWRIGLVVSNREDAGALDRARSAGVPVAVIATKGQAEDEVAGRTAAALEAHGVDVIFLAGYLRLLPAAVVASFRHRILNVHPALLPAFGGKGMYGMNVHRAVLESGARISGPTVHLADEVYDQGRILAQWPVPVRNGDTPEDLAARVLAAEHRLYPMVADHVCRALARGLEPTPVVFSDHAWPAVPPHPPTDPQNEDPA